MWQCDKAVLCLTFFIKREVKELLWGFIQYFQINHCVFDHGKDEVWSLSSLKRTLYSK